MKDPQEKSLKEAWILCLILGIVMINFPFIHIFNNERTIFGVPTIIVYFFVGWPASILVTWFFVRYLEKNSNSIDDESRKDNSP